MKLNKLFLILALIIATGITCAYAAMTTKYSSKFIKRIQDCENYEETIQSEFEGQSFTTQRKIVGWRNGYCRYEEVVKSPTDTYKINCNFSSIQLEELYTSMKDKSKEPITFSVENFQEQKDEKTGAVKYVVIGHTPIKGNSAFVTWTKYQNNPYFCKAEKLN